MTKTVLIVEDDVMNRKLFQDVLVSRGYAVIEAGDAPEAMALIRNRRPDLVVMDVGLRSALTGLDVVAWLKAAPDLAAIPVLVVTAYAMTDERARIAASGCDAYLFKPVDLREFLARVAALLGGCG
jgi:two-component system cell cycle response regulator DivK